jgi:hypothetical protein
LKPKIPIWVILEGLGMEILVYFMTIRNILRPFGINYGRLVQFVVIWHVVPNLVCWDEEKSGNPGRRKSVFSKFSPELSDSPVRNISFEIIWQKNSFQIRATGAVIFDSSF